MIAYGYFVNGPATPAKSRMSKSGPIHHGAAEADALEAGKTSAAGPGGKHNGDSDEDHVPLLRNVSKESDWAGQNVVVMQVDHQHARTGR